MIHGYHVSTEAEEKGAAAAFYKKQNAEHGNITGEKGGKENEY